jgi:hypothetical protein
VAASKEVVSKVVVSMVDDDATTFRLQQLPFLQAIKLS